VIAFSSISPSSLLVATKRALSHRPSRIALLPEASVRTAA
jgi:hypothetical protein